MPSFIAVFRTDNNLLEQKLIGRKRCTMKQENRSVGGWILGACGPLLPDDEINVLTGFLTCKVPNPSSAPNTAGEVLRPDTSHETLTDPIYSLERPSLSKQQDRSSSPLPWAEQTGSYEAPITIQSEMVNGDIDSESKIESTNNNSKLLKPESLWHREARQETPANIRRHRVRALAPMDENSLTEDAAHPSPPSPPRFPGPEVATNCRRRLLNKDRRPGSLAPSSRLSCRSPSSSMDYGIGIELRKVFENEEFVTFRKVPYSSKPSIPCSMHDGELTRDDDVDVQSRRSNASHQVLVVTKKRYSR